MTLTYVLLADVVRSMPLRWRLIHIWGLIPFAYYLFLLIACFEIVLLYPDVLQRSMVLDMPLAVLFYAFFGGILRGLWWLHQKVQEKHFRPQFTMPYLAGPWMAVLFGIIVWLVLTSGLILLSDSDQPTTTLAVYAFVFIGGFSWEWGIGLIDRARTNIG